MYDELTILVTSCKAYEDVLEISEQLYSYYWKDCPYARFLVVDEISNNKTYLNNFTRIIVAGADTKYKNQARLTHALEKIKTQYVLFLLEDMLICNKINTELIEYAVNTAKKYSVGCLRLNPVFFGKKISYFNCDDSLIEYDKHSPYRISYAPAIWNIDFLTKISKEFDNAGDFERKGSFLSNSYNDKILGSTKTLFPYINGISRGKWELEAIKFLDYFGIKPDFSNHRLMNASDEFKQAFLGYLFNINPLLILKMQNKANIGKKY